MVDTEKKHSGSIVGDIDLKHYKTPAQKRQQKMLIIIIAVIAAFIGTFYFFIVPQEDVYTLKNYDSAFVRSGDLTQTVQVSGLVTIPVQLHVLSTEDGNAHELYVNEGESVTSGQDLALLQAPELIRDIEDLNRTLQKNKQNLLLQEVQYRQNLAGKQRQLAAINRSIADVYEDIAKYEELVTINAARQSDLEAARDSLENLEYQKSEKEIEIADTIELQTISLSISNSDITQLETSISRLVERLDNLLIQSPMDGEIVALTDALTVPGSKINANMSLFTIADPDSVTIELEILESYAGVIRVGQEVEMTINGNPVMGAITTIGNVATNSPDGLGAVVTIKVKPDVESGQLLLGSTALGIIETGTIENTMIIPRGPYLTTGSQRYLYKIEGDTAVRVDAVFGEIIGNNVEIISGVTPGDEIIISGYQNFIEYSQLQLEKGD